MENNYIVLISKVDFIDFFKNGKFHTACCPNIKFDGNIETLRSNEKLADALFKKANPIEYSIDYLLLHICKTGSINTLQIKDVISIYALDNSAYSIGIDMNPAVVLNPPIWQKAFEKFQIQTNLNKALEGVKLIEELFGIEKLICTKIKKKDLVDTFNLSYYGREPEGDLSPWTYLLCYERHENYPKDGRGYFIDAIHVLGNIKRKSPYHNSMIENSHKGREINELTNPKFNYLVSFLTADNIFSKKVKAATGITNFIAIAALFLQLKEVFKNGINGNSTYMGMSLYEFTNSIKRYNIKYLKPALFLLGITLGWDHIYKLMYKRWDLPILSTEQQELKP